MTGITHLNLPALWAAGQEMEANKQRSRLLDLQFAELERKRATEVAQLGRQQQLIAALPADQQLLASADPAGFISAQMERLKPGKPVAVAEGGALVDPLTGQAIYERGYGGVIGSAPLPGMPAAAPAAAPAPGANLLGAAPPTQPAAAPTIAPGGGRTIPTGPAQLVQGEVPTIYQPYIADAATAHGVDGGVLGRMLLKETAPNGKLTSRAGARGVMQFMPGTAEQYNVDVNDPASSIDGAGKMMKYLLQKYNGDYRLAVGAYNWGEGNVDKWLAAGGDPAKVPAETMDYVRSIVGTMTTGPTDDVATPAIGQASPDPRSGGGGLPPGQYPPGAVGFARNEKTGEYISGGRPGYGVLLDANKRPIGTALLPGQTDPEVRQQQELDLRRQTEARQAEADKRNAERQRGDTRFNDENTLRDEVNTLTKDYRVVSDAYRKIQGAAKSGTGAGDMSMLYSFVKLLDPGSVVRESEFATAAASGSYGERIQGAVQRLLTGEKLPDSLRADFMREADNLFQSQKRGFDNLTKQYRGIAERRGLNADNVLGNYGEDAPPTEPDPAAWQSVALPADVTLAGRQGKATASQAQALPPGVPALPPGFRVVR